MPSKIGPWARGLDPYKFIKIALFRTKATIRKNAGKSGSDTVETLLLKERPGKTCVELQKEMMHCSGYFKIARGPTEADSVFANLR